MALWDPFKPLGGNTVEDLRTRDLHPLERPLLRPWPLHRRAGRGRPASRTPDVNVLVHPGVPAWRSSSAVRPTTAATEYIIRQVEAAAPGSTWAIGTEINLVNRLAKVSPGQDRSSASIPRSAPAPRCTGSTQASCSGRFGGAGGGERGQSDRRATQGEAFRGRRPEPDAHPLRLEPLSPPGERGSGSEGSRNLANGPDKLARDLSPLHLAHRARRALQVLAERVRRTRVGVQGSPCGTQNRGTRTTPRPVRGLTRHR